jgi:hypothetical protein
VLPALGPSLSHLKSRARVLSGCAILDYFPPFNITPTLRYPYPREEGFPYYGPESKEGVLEAYY